ncbi:DnaA regulatory inactivator Hda [Natronospira bacteriovora]|uniref:DnaA regulatory inactivator Hda n=1 Tax=Natronospira bacteriovora TaxID=3069753 RepID=A0ABU0W5Z3_9GAMM|nr:DnaA regulatory inactivator Hda [Natronospira sp. AB-CW4]MDQ2069446.1 DnaA regulatory inactivator Hda [Natronospira sp. AB-CW4]
MSQDELPAGGEQLPLGIELSVESRLEDFFQGDNVAAVSASRAMAAGEMTGCLFLAGPPASGKTHLLQGSCHHAHALKRQAAYLPLRQPALRSPDLLAGWESFELVCIDDLETVAGLRDWERALFRLFEGLKEQGGGLLVTAAALPGGLGLALPDLASRLASGPVYQLASLDDEDRVRALKKRLAQRGLALPDDSARWLMRRARRDMHTLMDLADRLDRLSLSAQRRLTIPFLREVLPEASD